MRFIHLLLIWLLIGGVAARAFQPDAKQVNDSAPIPKLDADGPTSFVTGMAFSPDGQTLYAAGWDKVIRVWRRDARGQFKLDPAATFRVPIGPGPAGQLNAIAVSSDGRWLAGGGNAAFRHGSTFDRPGLVVPSLGSMDRAMREDQGTIFVFDVRTREVRQLRGHQGAVVAIAFAEGQPLLASAGQEWDEQSKTRRGAVRLWNVADEKMLAVTKGLTEPKSRPGLAVIPPPVSSRESRLPTVAIAWGDERLLLWNPITNQLQPANDGRYNNTVAQFPGLGIVTGSASGLKVWQASEPPAVRSRFEQTLGRAIPRAMARVPSRADADTLALVAREPGTEEDRLYLVNPRAGQLLTQPVALWNGRGTQPAVAASVAGDVAVAGGRDHRIVVYRAAELRQNRAARQVLDSSGEPVRLAAIARQGKRIGLVLSSNPKSQPGQVRTRLLDADRVFDVGAGEFVADPRGWTIDAPDAGGWSVRYEPARGGADRSVLSIVNDGRVASRVELGARQQLGDYTVLPPRAPHDRPLSAVAYFDFDSGQPVLALFDAASGQRVREYLGHTGRITSVAFSRDGLLLVTAGEDETACVWTLADLDQVLGARGQLAGLKIDSRATEGGKTQLIVAQADSTLVTAGIAAGDEIEGFVSADGLRNIDTVRDFYQAVSLVKPGATVTLRRLREANDREDVKVVVGQGIDERKPLFTFFKSRSGPRGAARWIGWSPLGPYESSDQAIEKLLGWHFNTGRAELPVAFASADQYRNRFATKGLLAKLLETGRPQLPVEREPDPPAMSLWLEQPGQEPLALEPGTSVVARRVPTGLEAATGPFPAHQVESIEWSLGEELGVFQPTDGAWRADLTGISWKRGWDPLESTCRHASLSIL